MNDSEKMELLHQHYQDSFSRLREHLKLRDRAFLYLLLIFTVTVVRAAFPADSDVALADFIKSKIGFWISNPGVINSALWFLILCFSIRYFQAVIFVERQYPYIHMLEEKLSTLYGEPIFTRESKQYLSNFPAFGRWLDFLYKWFFPIVLILVSLFQIVRQFPGQFIPAYLFNVLLVLAIVVSTVLYLIAIHRRGKKSESAANQSSSQSGL